MFRLIDRRLMPLINAGIEKKQNKKNIFLRQNRKRQSVLLARPVNFSEVGKTRCVVGL